MIIIGIEIFNFLYLIIIIEATAKIEINPINNAFFTNTSPNEGDNVSILTIFNLVGSEPVIKKVYNSSLFFNASFTASCWFEPEPEPVIVILEAEMPLRSASILRLSTNWPSK